MLNYTETSELVELKRKLEAVREFAWHLELMSRIHHNVDALTTSRKLTEILDGESQ